MTGLSQPMGARLSFVCFAICGTIGLPLSAHAMEMPPGVGLLSDLFRDANLRFAGLVHSLTQARPQGAQVWADLTDYMAGREGIITLAYALIVMMIATGIEWLYWTYADPARRAIDGAEILSLRQGFRLAFRRLTLFLCGFLLFTVTILGSTAFFDWPGGGEHAVLALILVVVVVRLVWIFADCLFAPGRHHQRLLDVGPAAASVSAVAAVSLTIVTTVGLIVAPLIDRAGAADLAQTLRILAATLIAAIVFIAALLLRKVERQARGEDLARPPALPLPFLRSAIILTIYGIWLFGGSTPASLATILVLALAMQWHLRNAVFFFWQTEEKAGQVDDEDAQTDAAHSQPTSGNLAPAIILTLARYAIVIAAITAAFLALDIPMIEMATSANPLRRFIVHLFGLTGLALAAHIAWLAVRLPIDRRLHRLTEGNDPHQPGANARLLTLLPLMRTAFGVTLLALFVILALWSLGIDIGPLLAGAGVFGLALGFGAQALVRDIISGIFYLAEDVFRIGEYIEGGSNTKGTVERITLRTVALRHHDGPLHFVPYGSLGSIRNNSRDWSIDKFNLPLAVGVDSEQVRKIIKRVGEQMMEDPLIGPRIVEPLKTKVHSIEPGVKTFRCKFRCAPGNQFEIRRHAYVRIEAALKTAGIPFASGTQVLISQVYEQPPQPMPAQQS